MSTKKKQLTLVIALVVVIGLLAWQLLDLFGSDLHPAKTTVAKKTLVKKLSSHTPVPAQWKQKLIVSPSEQQYLQLAAEIQKAKMHHQLLQQKVAIAEAEKKLALSHQQAIGLSSSGSEEINTWSAEPVTHGSHLHLLYLAKVSDGHWQATLRNGSALMHVQQGSSLGDEGEVITILANGLWMKDKLGKHWVGFPGEVAPTLPGKRLVHSDAPAAPVIARSSKAATKQSKKTKQAKKDWIASRAARNDGKRAVRNDRKRLAQNDVATIVSLRKGKAEVATQKPKSRVSTTPSLRKGKAEVATHKPKSRASAPQATAKGSKPSLPVIAVSSKAATKQSKETESAKKKSAKKDWIASTTSRNDGKRVTRNGSSSPSLREGKADAAIHKPKSRVSTTPSLREGKADAAIQKPKQEKKQDLLSFDSLIHSKVGKQLVENKIKPAHSHRLSSDELLFLEQPAQGVTLLTPANPGAMHLRSFADSQQMGGSYELSIDGKKKLALGLFKSASTARLKALALQQEQPGLQVMPMNVKLLQESVLRG